MACREFEPMIAGWLYEEISPAEVGALKAHLEGCASCRAELERARLAREALREARPEVPLAPRILVVRPRTSTRWALAAALLGAASLATAAFLAGRSLPSRATSASPLVAESPPQTPLFQATGTADVARAETAGRVVPATSTEGAVTREELERRLALLESRLRRQRTMELDEVMAEIAGVEARTAAKIGQTRDALRYVALASQPEISEQ